MATTTAIAERIESGLWALLAEVDDLAEVAGEWSGWSDGNRASYSLDWDHLMADYLTELDEFYRAGQMTAGQRARYRELLRKLKEALPLMASLNLYRPPVLLDG